MSNPRKTGLSDNSIAAMAYFTPIPAIFFLAIRRYNKRPFVRFHSWQSVVLSAFVFLLQYSLGFGLGIATHLGLSLLWLQWLVYAIWIAIFLIWLWCVLGALNGKNCKLPVIGPWADEQAYR